MRKNKRKNSPLTLRECTIIEVMYRNGNSVRSIAKEIEKNSSTVSREIGGKSSRGIGKYIADVSHRKTLMNAEAELSCLEKPRMARRRFATKYYLTN